MKAQIAESSCCLGCGVIKSPEQTKSALLKHPHGFFARCGLCGRRTKVTLEPTGLVRSELMPHKRGRAQ